MATKTVAQKAKEEINARASEELSSVNLAAQQRQLRDFYDKEKKVDRYLSPMYRPYLGNTCPVSVNGITIYFPVDGSVWPVPQTFADEIDRKRMAIDAILTKQDRMASVKDNLEQSPGSLAMF